jgi:hypothetical protein
MELSTKIFMGLGAFALIGVTTFGLQAMYSPPPPVDMPAVSWRLGLNETFGKPDFAYTLQDWKPYSIKALPVIPGQDPAGGNNYSVMFIDLYATPYGIDGLSNYTGGIKVEYAFENLTGLAAFHLYGFATHSNNLGNLPGIYMTNKVDGNDASGYYVRGASDLPGTFPKTKALDSINVINVTVANDDGPQYNASGDGTYRILFLKAGGGLNALHITTSGASYKRWDTGQVTFTDDQSGIFYVSDTGGTGISDVILMLAVDGTVPDTFALHINASMDRAGGYR